MPTRRPPHRRLWGPLGEGGALYHGRVNTAVPVGPPRPSSITHPEAAPATVTCSYRHRWILCWGNLVHDTTTTKRSAVGNAWAGWGSIPVFFPLDGRSPVPTCEVSFPPRRSGECRKGISRPARCTREDVDRFGIPNPRKSGSVIGADRQRFGPSCVVLKRVPQCRTESGGIVLAANAGPRVPSDGVTLKRRCTYRPSVIYLIVNKLLSSPLSLALSLSLWAA